MKLLQQMTNEPDEASVPVLVPPVVEAKAPPVVEAKDVNWVVINVEKEPMYGEACNATICE